MLYLYTAIVLCLPLSPKILSYPPPSIMKSIPMICSKIIPMLSSPHRLGGITRELSWVLIFFFILCSQQCRHVFRIVQYCHMYCGYISVLYWGGWEGRGIRKKNMLFKGERSCGRNHGWPSIIPLFYSRAKCEQASWGKRHDNHCDDSTSWVQCFICTGI